MSEWEEKLNTLLSDPDAMAQVMQLAQSLSGGEAAQAEKPPPPPPSGNPLEALGLPALDPALIARLLPLVRQMNRPESNDTAVLLHALRPFLRQERQEKIERAAQLAKLLHLAKVFFTTQEGILHV